MCKFIFSFPFSSSTEADLPDRLAGSQGVKLILPDPSGRLAGSQGADCVPDRLTGRGSLAVEGAWPQKSKTVITPINLEMMTVLFFSLQYIFSSYFYILYSVVFILD